MRRPTTTRNQAFELVKHSLQDKEKDVLRFLFRNRGLPFNYKQVGKATGMGHNANSRLGTLRKKGLVTYVGKIYKGDRAGYYVINKKGIQVVKNGR